MARIFSFLFAFVFLGFGILGFFPPFKPNGYLFYIYRVNWATNTLHVLMGVFALWASITREMQALLFFQITGVLLGIWAILGFLYEETPIFGIFANNSALTWTHVIIGVIAFILGFGAKEAHKG